MTDAFVLMSAANETALHVDVYELRRHAVGERQVARLRRLDNHGSPLPMRRIDFSRRRQLARLAKARCESAKLENRPTLLDLEAASLDRCGSTRRLGCE